MRSPDERLKAIFAADQPSARDPAFVLAVLEAAEKRRLRVELVLQGLAATIAGALLWAAAPSLAGVAAQAAPLVAPVAAAVSVAITLALLARFVAPSAMLSPGP